MYLSLAILYGGIQLAAAVAVASKHSRLVNLITSYVLSLVGDLPVIIMNTPFNTTSASVFPTRPVSAGYSSFMQTTVTPVVVYVAPFSSQLCNWQVTVSVD
jgi:energy-converting hydrogenase Eha subunit A